MTEPEVDSVIEYFVDKTLSFGCEVENKRGGDIIIEYIDEGNIRLSNGIYTCDGHGQFTDYFKILGHPIMIGDVLDKLEKEMIRGRIDMEDHLKIEVGLLGVWRYCGFKKSLQGIRDTSGFKKYKEPTREVDENGEICSYYEMEQLKDPNTEALFKFLKHIKDG